ncbi:GntR family transcriptional regulator [Sporosarcina sp. ACRSM]|uniref:GntR family transcriptional regulator n=1 Tax=Sporosarcina sp. ACRSM TaxID=2918216 RepID=UPI001EF7058D|nr:GntR family transcriptional regulator [Sporosarcina sp. ACRSM]MCG7334898.1 GntR family transcriptional regulator [Sporosarcina sp. ACRSM]
MEKVIKPTSLAEQAYSLLKQSIISGKLAPKTELTEERLANDLGVSRTPLREAIRKLAMEGLIDLNKGKPATVATFTKEDSLDYLELRRVLEIYNIENIVLNDDGQLIKELENNLKEQMKAISSNDFQDFMNYDREFHLILASQNKNRKIKQLIHQMNTGINRAFLILSNTVEMSAIEAYHEHLRIIEAIKSKDLELSKREMMMHLKKVEDRFLIYFKREEEQ